MRQNAIFACFLVVLASCGGSHDDQTTSATDDPALLDHGAPSDVYPAFKPASPRVIDSGGRVLSAPKIAVITFSNDPLVADVERFVSLLGASSYWTVTTAEYGVAAASATPVHLSEEAPAFLDDVDVQSWLTGKVSANGSAFPAPDDQTVYAIFYPKETGITDAGLRSCDVFAAYHGEAVLGGAGGKRIPYVVIPRCEPDPDATTPSTELGMLTASASHELVEVATDPFPGTAPAYLNTTDFYGLPLTVAEVGNMCDVNAEATATSNAMMPDETGFPYVLKPTWSNAAASAGKNPCVPATGSYFNAAPVTTDMLDTTALFGRDIRGFKIDVGKTKTIEIDLFSSEPTGGPFQVSVDDITPLDPGDDSPLELTLDRSSGQNGEKLHLTVKVVSDIVQFSGFRLQSTLGDRQFVWYGLIETAGGGGGGGGG